MPMPCSGTPAGPGTVRPLRRAGAAPALAKAKAPTSRPISGLKQGLSTRCLRFARQVALEDARLACAVGQTLRSGTFTRRSSPKGFFDVSYIAFLLSQAS